jgi:hypothetical protein
MVVRGAQCVAAQTTDDRRPFSLRRELCQIVNSQLLFYFCHIVRVNVEAIPAEGLAFDLFELLTEAIAEREPGAAPEMQQAASLR